MKRREYLHGVGANVDELIDTGLLMRFDLVLRESGKHDDSIGSLGPESRDQGPDEIRVLLIKRADDGNTGLEFAKGIRRVVWSFESLRRDNGFVSADRKEAPGEISAGLVFLERPH